MKKQVSKAFNKKIYFLGIGKDNSRYWLESPSWDCGWYWGFGYVETYTNNKRPDLSRDISSHQHFDGLFFKGDKNAYDMFKDFFVDTPLNDSEIWKFIDFMKTFYALKESAEIFGRGYSHFTERAKLESVKNVDIVKTINEIMLPDIFKEIENILSDDSLRQERKSK